MKTCIIIKDDTGKKFILNRNYSEREFSDRILAILEDDVKQGIMLGEEEIIEIVAKRESGFLIWEPNGHIEKLYSGDKVKVSPDCEFEIIPTLFSRIKREIHQLLN